MVENRTNVVMITEEDIEQLLTEWNDVPQWVKAHVKSRCPAHRYEGKLLLNDATLVFDGWDVKEKKQFEIEIPFDGIIDVYVGFSHDLQADIDPTFGIGGSVPFAVCYSVNGNNQTVYFNTCSDNYPPHRHINNIRWYQELDEIVTRRKAVKAG